MSKSLRFIPVLSFFLLSVGSHAQYRSWNGNGLSPFKTYRCLNVYIDIIYNVTADPERENSYWKPGKEEGVNKNIPPFAGTYLLPDTTNIQKFKGSLTKRFYEASFGHFNLLGEAVSVTVRQSSISENGKFSWRQALRHAVNMLNEQGGLNGNSLNGIETLAEFSKDGDAQIDIVNIMFRNTSKEAGRLSSGGMSGRTLNLGLLVDGVKVKANSYTVQLLGSDNVLRGNTTILDHELGHKLFGGNAFHASGGNHWSTYSTTTFMGTQPGYGIMGGGKSSLVCTNGYERWRMHWTSAKFNPENIPIQASGKASDIQQKDGEMTFYLRDFITTGDAIRIQFPYKDNDQCSQQYLWIENHQIGRNNKEDYFMFADRECKDAGEPGITMYVQVGKDVLESAVKQEVWPSNETDNLKMLSAEGNFDMVFRGMGTDCMKWGHNNRKVFHYEEANPLSGQNDQTASFITSEQDQLTNKLESGVWIKELANSEIAQGWPCHGENNDIFTSGTVLNLSSNPVPVNRVTSYVKQGGGKIREIETNRNTSHIYLTGLRIELTEDYISNFGDSCMVYKVAIRWDDYTLHQDSRYTGSVVVNEKLIVDQNVTLKLNQSSVPTQAVRDSVSHQFTPPTILSVHDKGMLQLNKKSSLILEEQSTLQLDAGSVFNMDKKSNLIIKSGTSFVAKEGAKLDVHRRANIEVEAGAHVYIDSGYWSKLNTDDQLADLD